MNKTYFTMVAILRRDATFSGYILLKITCSHILRKGLPLQPKFPSTGQWAILYKKSKPEK